MKWYDLEHPDITEACRTGYPRNSCDDDRYDDDYDSFGDYGVDVDALDVDALFEEARLAEWDRKHGDF